MPPLFNELLNRQRLGSTAFYTYTNWYTNGEEIHCGLDRNLPHRPPTRLNVDFGREKDNLGRRKLAGGTEESRASFESSGNGRQIEGNGDDQDL